MFKSSRAGFTLVELLVTIAIIGILLGLLLPNLAAVQATAKAGAQAAILQSFGKGFIDFSTLDAKGRLCTGAYDQMTDGDVTKIGWVADLVNAKYSNVGKALDPINRIKINTPWTVVAGAHDESHHFNNVRWRTQTSFRPSDGALVTTVADVTGTTYFGTTQSVWDDGYHSNFAATWHFFLGDNNITEADAFATNADGDDPQRCPLDGDGPLSNQMLGDPTLKTSADKIVLMGPARPSMGAGNNMTAAEASTINDFIDPTRRRRVAKVGDVRVAGHCDGPQAEITATNGPYTVGAKAHMLNDVGPNCKAKKIRMPYGTIYAGGHANLLFADGSCRRVNDNNGYGGANRGDGWIGPYKSDGDPSTGSWNNFVLDNGAYDEIRDEVYLSRLRTILTRGGGSAE